MCISFARIFRSALRIKCVNNIQILSDVSMMRCTAILSISSAYERMLSIDNCVQSASSYEPATILPVRRNHILRAIREQASIKPKRNNVRSKIIVCYYPIETRTKPTSSAFAFASNFSTVRSGFLMND